MNGRPSLNTIAARAPSLFLLAVLAIGAFAAAGASAASINTRTVTRLAPVTRGSGYLALGDSVTFGYQEPNVIPAPNYLNPASFHGYPEQLGAALHLKVTNLACPGETSASLINSLARSLACENIYRKHFPLHVRYRGSQLADALAVLRHHPGIRLVSLMIGANDALLCQSFSADKCASPTEMHGVLAKIGRDIKQTLSEIRGRAHYAGQIAIVNYYSLDYSSSVDNAQSHELDRAMDAAARPFHVVIADGYAELRTASVRFGQSPCLAGLITELNGQAGSCGIHPSDAGQALLALALEKVIRL